MKSSENELDEDILFPQPFKKTCCLFAIIMSICGKTYWMGKTILNPKKLN